MCETPVSKFKLPVMVFCVAIVSVLFISSSVFAEEPKQEQQNDFRSPKKKERIDMIKKMKLLEVLSLDEAKSEKLLIKLNAHEKKITENRSKHHDTRVKLEEAIKANNANEIKTLSKQLVDLQESFNKDYSDKVKDLQTVLSDVEFAKFLCFENSFMRDFFDSCMDGKYKKKAKHKNKTKRAKR